MFKYFEVSGVPPALSAAWRNQCMALMLLVPAYLESRHHPIEWGARKDDLRWPVWVYIFVPSAGWAVNLIMWLVAIQYISVVKAALYVSMHPLILCFYLRLTVSASKL